MSLRIQNKDILVIDDKPENLKLLDSLLAASGQKTRLATNGILGLKAARKRIPDLILLDINIPEMNGFEVCKSLKADPNLKNVPVIFISALGETSDIVTALNCGGVDYITKPFEIEEVEARVNTQLQLRELQLENERYSNKLEELVGERTTQLVEANDTIKRSETLKSEFLRMISHEVRTPLNGIMGSVELFFTDADDDGLKDIFDKSMARMNRLVEQAEAIGRLELIAPELNRVQFKDLWSQAVSRFDRPNCFNGSNLTPPASWLKCDAQAISLALSLVFEIIFKLNEPDIIDANFLEDGENLNIRFPLTGKKIKEVYLDDIFDWTTTGRQQTNLESTGLGAIVAAKAIQASHGSIKVVLEPTYQLEITLLLDSKN